MRHVASNAEAFALLRERLVRYKQTAAHPTLLLLQLSTPLSLLLSHMPSLRSDFPLICIPSHTADNAYPAFHWLSFAVRHALLRYLTCSDWLTSHLELCRYAHLPIGNLQVDVPSQLLDVMYARSLRDGKQVLWTSRGGGGEIELGGRWVEEERSMVGEGEDSRRLEVNHSGCYRTTCYELTMQRLCINAVLRSTDIEEENGTAMVEAGGDSSSSASSSTPSGSVARSFAILKQCVTSLFLDCTQRRSLHADLLLQHFHRWMYAHSSSLSDPLLHAHVATLMSQLYRSLLSRLALLGSTLIHASFHRIILCTKKTDPRQAAAYIRFIQDTLLKRPMFSLIGFQVTAEWAALLYLDPYNRSAIHVSVSEEEEKALVAGEEGGGGEGGEVVEPVVEQRWQMADYLPLRCRQWLLILLKRYLLQPYLHSLQHRHNALPHSTSSPSPSSQPVSSSSSSSSPSDCCHSHLLSLLRHIESQLYSILIDLSKPLASPPPDLSFPTHLPGSHLPLTHPGLELTKQLTHILSLDPSTTDTTRTLRDNLFRLLSINAWSAQAAFVNPCRVVLLVDVVCDFCNVMKDVDLCRNGGEGRRGGLGEEEGEGREGEREGEEGGKGSGRGVRVLQCESCTFAYDARMVEERLMRGVRQRVLRYQLQDLVCRVCGSQQDRYLQRRCDCSGEYRGQREEGGREDRVAEWRVMERVCKEYGYHEAHEMIAFLRRMEGGADRVERPQRSLVDAADGDLDTAMRHGGDDDEDDDA